LVLHLGEEQRSLLFAVLVIHAEREQVADLLVETFLRRTNVADARQQLVEMIHSAGVLEAFVVHDEALDQIFGQLRGGPLAELRAARGTDPVTDGQDGVEMVVIDVPADVATAFVLNYSEFPKSSFRFN